MLLLTSTSDKIQLVTGSALTVDVHASWIDNASGTITPGRTNTAITTATTTDIVAAPGSSVQRNVKTIIIRNKDVSSDTVTVRHTDGTTIVQLFSCVLLTGEELCFDEATGWKHFTAAGSLKFDPLPAISDAQLLANTSGGSAAPIGTGASTYLDYVFGNTVGNLVQRGSSAWSTFVPGSAGQTVTSQGSGQPNVWADPPSQNLIINPSMEIDQVNEGTSVGGSGYIIDQWNLFHVSGNGATFTGQRVVDAPSAFTNSLKASCTAGAAITASDFCEFSEWIEAYLITSTAMGTASANSLAVGFWVKSSIAPYTACASLQNHNATRSYVFNFTVNSTNTWEFKSAIIPGDTSGTWQTTGINKGALLSIAPASGSTYQGTANVWQTGNFVATSSITNTFFTTTNATFQITGVNLVVGTVLPPFSRRLFADELILCQRHYEKSYNVGTALASATNEGAELATLWGSINTQYFFPFRFKTTKRNDPTITFYSPFDGASAKVNLNNTSSVAASVFNTGTNGAQVGSTFTPTVAGFITWQWTADTRL